MLILFDVTQFLLQHGFRTPAGISRVELAYVKHLLANYRSDVRFVTSYPPIMRLVPTEAIERYVNATEAVWGHALQKTSGETAQKIEQFLGLKPATSNQVKGKHGAPTGTWARQLSALRAIASACLPFRSMTQLYNAKRRTEKLIYVSVSGWRLPTPWVSRWLRHRPEVSSVFLLHDIIPITHPQYVRPGATDRHESYIKSVVDSATVVIGNSTNTITTFAAYCDRMNLRQPRLVLNPLGYESSFDPARATAYDGQSDSAPPFFMAIGTVDPRKNYELLLRCWKDLAKSEGASAPKLLIVGKRGWAGDNILSELDRSPELRQIMVQCSGISDDLLFSLMSQSRAVLFPSFEEGFGLPLVEGLAHFVPVISSDILAFREIGQKIPEFLSPNDQPGWLEAIRAYAQPSSNMRDAQLGRLKGFKPFKWSTHFSRFDELLGELNQPN